MSKHRSIGERIRRAKSLDSRREAALDWAANWRADHIDTLMQLERALGERNLAAAGQCLGQLKALDDKAMTALPRVIEALADDDVV